MTKLIPEKIELAIKMINHHITAIGGNNHGSLIAAIKILEEIKEMGNLDDKPSLELVEEKK